MLRAFQRHTDIFLSASQGTRAASEDAEEESETDSEEAGRDSETEPLVEEAGRGGGELGGSAVSSGKRCLFASDSKY